MTRSRLIPLLLLSMFGGFNSKPLPPGDAPIVYAYLPIMAHERQYAVGFDAWDDALPGISPAAHRPDYIRIGFGSDASPLDTPYQKFLMGGWGAVDAEVLSDLTAIRALGAEPLVILMPGGSCVPPPTAAQLSTYAAFVINFVDRYDLDYIEPWNEPDAQGAGLPSLFGCGPSANNLITLLNNIKAGTNALVGVSFMHNSATQVAYIKAVAPAAEWVGVHIYGIWTGTGILYPYPGSPAAAYDNIRGYAPGKPVWITETNLRNPAYTCSSSAFQQAQAGYLNIVLGLDAVVTILFTYYPNPAWECTGILGSAWESAGAFSQPAVPYP